MKEQQHRACQVVQADPFGQHLLHIGQVCQHGVMARQRRILGLSVEAGVRVVQRPGRIPGRAADHDAINVGELLLRRGEVEDAAVDLDQQVRSLRFEAPD